MKLTIHDGSSRSYSVEVPNPEPHKGKHAKTPTQAYKRHMLNVIRHIGIEKAIKKKGE